VYGARSTQDQTVVDVYEEPIFLLHMPLVVSNHAFLPDLVVKSIVATRNDIQIVVENQGSAAVTQGFYVDVYVNPKRAPVDANEAWHTSGVSSGRGLVWGIVVEETSDPSQGIIAPLVPGQSLTLRYNDDFYWSDYSAMSWPLAVGTPIYAQVDSFPNSAYPDGLVLENHEYYDQAYNNIVGPVYSTNATGSAFEPMPHTWTGSRSRDIPPRP
jgi:hypothetical protein